MSFLLSQPHGFLNYALGTYRRLFPDFDAEVIKLGGRCAARSAHSNTRSVTDAAWIELVTGKETSPRSVGYLVLIVQRTRLSCWRCPATGTSASTVQVGGAR